MSRHRFFAWEIGPFVTQWKCAGCKMRVPNLRIAKKLQKERCYG